MSASYCYLRHQSSLVVQIWFTQTRARLFCRSWGGDRDAGSSAGLLGDAQDESEAHNVPGPGRGWPHVGHGIRASDSQDRRPSPSELRLAVHVVFKVSGVVFNPSSLAARPTDADVECHVAEGRAALGWRLPQGLRPDQHRFAHAARQPQHHADRRRVRGLREGVQVRPTSPHSTYALYCTLLLCPCRLQKILEDLSHEKENKTLIFVETKRKADDLTRRMKRDGWPVSCIHGDKSQQEREWVLKSMSPTPLLLTVPSN